MTMLANVLVREVPAEHLTGVGRGDYQVFGSIIRSTTSGRIVGHLPGQGLHPIRRTLRRLVGTLHRWQPHRDDLREVLLVPRQSSDGVDRRLFAWQRLWTCRIPMP